MKLIGVSSSEEQKLIVEMTVSEAYEIMRLAVFDAPAPGHLIKCLEAYQGLLNVWCEGHKKTRRPS
jgi:hypothetical protein